MLHINYDRGISVTLYQRPLAGLVSVLHALPSCGSGRGKEPMNLAVTGGDGPGVLQDGRGCSQEGDAGAGDRWTLNPSGFLWGFLR